MVCDRLCRFLIRSGEYAEAIPYLKEALKMADGHSQEIRMTFLLAQLQAKTGDKAGAYRSYQAVIKKNPTFRTEMNARINQTEVFTGSDMSKIEKRLRRLARNYKIEIISTRFTMRWEISICLVAIRQKP